MNTEFLVKLGLLASLIGPLLGSLVALVSKKDAVQRVSQMIVLAALACGAVASGVFLLKTMPALAIFDSKFFFPGDLVIDHLSAIFYFLVNAVGFLAVMYGWKYLANERAHYNIGYIQFLTALFILGMQAVVLASSPVFFIFAWEVMSFSSFLLVLSDLKINSIKPAVFYLIMTHLGAGAILAGFLFLSGGQFNVDFAQLAVMSKGLPVLTIVSAFLLFFFGFGSKAGLFPFHGWLPEAHPQAPSHISALMSGIMLKIAVYGMLRVVLFILPTLPTQLGFVVVAVGLFSAIFGVLYSLVETDIKRILAFSSIENLGLIFTMIGIHLVARNSGMSALADLSLLAGLFLSISHAFFKSGLFLSAGIAVQAFHTRNIEKMGGMAKKMRMFSVAVLLLALTAAALPPSGAFASEWLLIQTIVNSVAIAPLSVKILLIIVLVVVGVVAGMAVFSMVRFFGIGFLAEARSPKAHINEDPAVDLLLPVALLGLMAFLLGSVAQPVIGMIGKGLVSEKSTNIVTPFSFDPLLLALMMLAALVLAWGFRRATSNVKNEREYHTWDCGQPIDASMEYTATAFSAPIRFFFRSIIRAKKQVSMQSLVKTNPWLLKKSIHIETSPIWDKYFYSPVIKLVTFLSSSIRKLQNGNIQFYITLMLITLIITAIVTL